MFGVATFYLGVFLEEIPHQRGNEPNYLKPYLDQIVPISFTFFSVMIASIIEIRQMRLVNQLNFLEREFVTQTLTVAGVVMVGIFFSWTYLIDVRLPIVIIVLARLGMEAYSTKKHIRFRKVVAEKIRNAKESLKS